MHHLPAARSAKLLSCSLIFSCLATGANGQTVDRPRDDGLLKIPDVNVELPKIGDPSADRGEIPTGAQPAQLDDADLKTNSQLAGMILGQSMQRRNWRTVRRIMAYYTDIPGHDPMLALYARGAIDRQDGRHGRAIAAYRRMIEQDASLDYVRLDLAAMLFEDKQYRESRRLFEMLRTDRDLVPGAKAAVERYLASIGAQDKWRGTFRVGYRYNDNVNNASADPYLYLWGLRFEKDPESLPHSANAINYYANLSRDENVGGNNFVSLDAVVEGDHYWDDKNWRETNATIRAGYKYRGVRTWLSVQPNYSRQWLGGDPFRRMIGVSAEYGRWIDPQWQIMGSYSWFNKKYDLPNYNFYDGNLHALSATAVYFHSPATVFYGGLTVQRDQLESKDESSSRDGASLGVIKVWKHGLNVRGNARYSYRTFHDYSLWDRTAIRRDHEYQVDLSVTHSKLRFAGVYPRLGYQFLKIDSSISSLYSRTGNQLTLSLETSF